MSVQLQLSVDLSVTALLALILLVGHINNQTKYQPRREIQYCGRLGGKYDGGNKGVNKQNFTQR